MSPKWSQNLVPNRYQKLEQFLVHVFQKSYYTRFRNVGTKSLEVLNQTVTIGGLGWWPPSCIVVVVFGPLYVTLACAIDCRCGEGCTHSSIV